MTSVESAIKEAIAPIVLQANLFLEALQITTAGKHRVIRVLVDSLDPQTPLSLDEVTAVTKPISAILDTVALLGDKAFTLEVSSPGVDLPLTLPRHWAKNHGRLVALVKKSGEKVTGRIGNSDEEAVEIESKKGDLTRLPYADITRAQIEIEFK
jgi:ribosome maturation factor RimP